jgi:SPP1 family predicted phage head-tail adaptor
MSAGDLKRRVAFDKRSNASDGAGGTTTAFAEQFVVWAKYIHLRGGESVMAARLDGRHQQIVRVRTSTNTRLITSDWRARDNRNGTVFAIRDVTPTEDGAWLDFLCETGVAP